LSTSVLLLASVGAFAQGATPTKIGIIWLQQALGSTKDGQKASAELNGRFEPTKTKLQKKQAEIEADKAKLNQGSNAMSTEQKEKLMRDIDQKTKSFNRDAQDFQDEADQETGKIMQQLGDRMMVVIKKYAMERRYSLVLDVSNQQQSPVLWAADGADITADIIKLYDESSGAPATSGGPAAPANPPAARPAAATPSPARKTPAPPAK